MDRMPRARSAMNPGNYGKIQPFHLNASPTITSNHRSEDSVSSAGTNTIHTMRMQTTPPPDSPSAPAQNQRNESGMDDHRRVHSITSHRRQSMDTEDSVFIPAPGYHKRHSLKSLDLIKAEKERKRQLRLEQKRGSQSSRRKMFGDLANLRASSPSDNHKNHHRAYSSDVIGIIDFGSGDEDDGGIEMLKPGGRGHKVSIHDQQWSGAWRVQKSASRNTMAPRPTARSIIECSSKNDEFILLFQQQLNEVKREQIKEVQRKKGSVRMVEKRKSVPDFAMLSEIGSERDDEAAHRNRLSTLREAPSFGKITTLESLDEQDRSGPSPTASLSPESPRRYRTRMGSKHELLLRDGPTSGRLTTSMTAMEVETPSWDPHRKRSRETPKSKSLHTPKSRNAVNSVSGSMDIQLDEEWDVDTTRHGCFYYFCCCCVCDLFCCGRRRHSAPSLHPSTSASHRSYDRRWE